MNNLNERQQSRPGLCHRPATQTIRPLLDIQRSIRRMLDRQNDRHRSIHLLQHLAYPREQIQSALVRHNRRCAARARRRWRTPLHGPMPAARTPQMLQRARRRRLRALNLRRLRLNHMAAMVAPKKTGARWRSDARHNFGTGKCQFSCDTDKYFPSRCARRFRRTKNPFRKPRGCLWGVFPIRRKKKFGLIMFIGSPPSARPPGPDPLGPADPPSLRSGSR